MPIIEMGKTLSQMAQHKAIITHGIGNPPSALTVKKNEFDNLLTEAVSKINNLHNNVDIASRNYLTGESDIGINDVMVMQQKSSIALSMGVQTISKFVAAYREVMNMNI